MTLVAGCFGGGNNGYSHNPYGYNGGFLQLATV